MSRLFLLIMCFVVFSSASVRAQKMTYCEDNLEQVKSNYLIGDFRKVIESLGKCIQDNGFRNSDAKAQAYELLALTYIAIDSLEKAEDYIKSIVVLKPNYTQPTDLKNIVFKDIFDLVCRVILAVSNSARWWIPSLVQPWALMSIKFIQSTMQIFFNWVFVRKIQKELC